MATALTESARNHLDKMPARAIVDYLRERFGPEVGPRIAALAASGESLPIATRELLELTGERLDMTTGHWMLKAYYENGRLRKVSRHHTSIGATLGLDEFDATRRDNG